MRISGRKGNASSLVGVAIEGTPLFCISLLLRVNNSASPEDNCVSVWCHKPTVSGLLPVKMLLVETLSVSLYHNQGVSESVSVD